MVGLTGVTEIFVLTIDQFIGGASNNDFLLNSTNFNYTSNFY